MLAAAALATRGFAADAMTMTLGKDLASPSARLASVAFIEGRWTGLGLGGTGEEIGSPGRDVAMKGMFRLTRAGKPDLFEIMTLVEENDTLVLRIKHLDKELKSREAQNECTTFKLVKSTPEAVYFDGLTFAKEAGGGLTIDVRMGRDGDKPREVAFKFRPFPK
jgi:hypothetical protein